MTNDKENTMNKTASALAFRCQATRSSQCWLDADRRLVMFGMYFTDGSVQVTSPMPVPKAKAFAAGMDRIAPKARGLTVALDEVLA